MTSPDLKAEAERLLNSRWCNRREFRAWAAEQEAKGLACKPCATKPSPKCPCHQSSYYRSKRAKRAYRQFFFMQKFGIDEATYKAWTHEWMGNQFTAYCQRAEKELNQTKPMEVPTSSVPSIPTQKLQKPVVPPEHKAGMLPDPSQSDSDANVADKPSGDLSSDYNSLSESESDQDDDDNDEDSRATTPDHQRQLALRNVPVNEAPSIERDDSELQSETMDLDLDHPNSLRAHKDAILTLAKALVPNYKMEIDDDTSDELLAIVLETRQRFTLVLQRNEAKAREAELMEEIRMLKVQLATSAAQKSLTTRLEAMVQDLQAAALEAAESTRKRKSSLDEDNSRPSQRARHTSLVQE
ncbi:hypothetical protein ONZ45_g11017 [Pleurotus djamor]|nr:hypothetical protein ONZ45_g11017 [Pleurotus djamor]